MQKNVASQKLIVFAFDSTTNLPKTGDAANLTAYVSIDYGAVTVLGDTSATEMDATNAKGYYLFDLTQGETNGNTLLFSAKSATANIVVVGAPAAIQTVPSSFVVAPGSANALLIGGSNAATTFAGLTTGALSCTTITASGAVAFQSTFAVTTSSAFGAVTLTTLTASGAVAFQSTFAVTTSTALGALSCTTLTASGAVALQSTVGITGAVTLSSTLAVGATTLSALTVTNNLLVSGTTTLAGVVSATAANDIRGVLLQKTISAAMDELTGDPGATPTGAQALMLGYMAQRNQRLTTATSDIICNSAGATILTAVLSDDTVTFTKAKYA